MRAAIGGTCHAELAVYLLDRDVARHTLAQLALGTVHRHTTGLDRDRHAGWHGNWLLPDSGHRLPLPDLSHDLATDALAPSVVTGHHSLGGGDDRRSHPALDPRDVGMVDVGPPAGPRDTLEAGDYRRPLARVLQSHPQLSAGVAGRGRDLLE